MNKLLLLSAALVTCVFVSAQQNVGIGTNDPKSKLDVKGGITVGNSYSGVNAAPTDGAIIEGPVGVGTNAPNSKAALDVTSTTKGMFMPRLDNTQAAALGLTLNTTHKGLLIFNLTSNRTEYWDGTAWKAVGDGAGGPPSGAAGGDLTGSYPNPTITTNAVTSAKILDGTVTSADLATPAVNATNQIFNTLPVGNGGTGTSSAPANGQILIGNGTNYNVANIGGGTGISVTNGAGSISINNTGDTNAGDDVTTSSTAGGDVSGAFSNLQINANAVGNAEIAGDAVTSAKIANGTIAAADMGQMGAGNGDVLKWNGSAWAPAADNNAGGTVTSVGASAPLSSSGGATPSISITQANTSTNGYLSSTDWNTFSNKPAGSGTTNYVPKWTAGSTLGNSQVYDNGSGVGIGNAAPSYKLHVTGDIYADGGWLRVSGTQGIHFESYGGGFYMSDGTWIRGYNGKSLWMGGAQIGTDGGLTIGYGGVTAPAGGAIIAGNVGIGNNAPGTKLDVTGAIRTNNQLISTIATGTAPLAVSSTTLVTNLNADLLDGRHLSEIAFRQSDRDFPNGTLIESDIDYSVFYGEPFLLEIEGNSYGNLVPLDLKFQGYIYNGTIINMGGISNGVNISGLVAFNYNNHLCFWFPSQGYWNGYSVFVNDSYAGSKRNRLLSITHAAKPGAITKEVALSSEIRQSWHSGNFTPGNYITNGSGATNYLARWTSATTLGTGATIDNGTNVGIGVSPSHKLDVAGKTRMRRGGYEMGTANEGQLEIATAGAAGEAAFISFHREGYWGAHFGLETDNYFSTRGWSAGASGYTGMRTGTLDVRGSISGVNGVFPQNGAIRLTPNMHINAGVGHAVILNWDNATTGSALTFRIGNGASADVFDVLANGYTGIGGLTNPSRMLEVNGDIKLTDGGHMVYLGENVTTSGKIGINYHTDGDPNYWIGKPAGAWVQPLHVAFYTGIKLGANTGYGGTRIYNNSDMATEIASFGNGDNHTRINYNLYAPIMYDINDGTYYVDPNGTTKLNALLANCSICLYYCDNNCGSQYSAAKRCVSMSANYAYNVSTRMDFAGDVDNNDDLWIGFECP